MTKGQFLVKTMKEQSLMTKAVDQLFLVREITKVKTND